MKKLKILYSRKEVKRRNHTSVKLTPRMYKHVTIHTHEKNAIRFTSNTSDVENTMTHWQTANQETEHTGHASNDSWAIKHTHTHTQIVTENDTGWARVHSGGALHTPGSHTHLPGHVCACPFKISASFSLNEALKSRKPYGYQVFH